jgi:hypothetical protein
MSWHRAPLWDLRPDITSCRNVAVWNLPVRLGYFTSDGQSVSQSVCLGIEHPCGTCDQILLPVGMLLSEICLCGEVTLRLTVSQSISLGIEYPCGTCDQILLPVGMLLTEICLWGEVTLRLTVSRSVSQYVLVSSTPVGLATRYYFLSECCCLKFDCEVRLLYDWQSVSQCLGIEYPCGTCDQILLPIGMLLSEICGFVSVGRPLWREDGSEICSVITQWSESLRTRNHTLLSDLRLLQPGRPGSRIDISRNRVVQLYPWPLGYLYWIYAIECTHHNAQFCLKYS